MIEGGGGGIRHVQKIIVFEDTFNMCYKEISYDRQGATVHFIAQK